MNTTIAQNRIIAEALEIIAAATKKIAATETPSFKIEMLSQIVIDAGTAINRASICEYDSAENEITVATRRLAAFDR